GCAKLDSLVIKASAGTLFKAAIIRCDNLAQSLQQLKQKSVNVIGMEANAALRLGEYYPKQSAVFVLGNETEGLSNEVRALCDSSVKIPMLNGVGSLNVAITASLIAFRNAL
ncbi:MAG: 23S rRNA (guanosine2251-2'-O)-methyltransferase, partial [Lentisphaeria bacterium]